MAINKIAGKSNKNKQNPSIKAGGNFLFSPEKPTRDNLRELEIRYQVALENSKQLLYDFDLKTGRIFWSGNIFGVTGYQPSEFDKFGVTEWEKMIHPEDRKRAADLLAKAIKEKSKYHIEYRFRRKRANYAFIEDEGVIVGKNRMVGTMKDISVFKEKINDLEKMNQLMIGRELKMVELKEKIKKLESGVASHKSLSLADEFQEGIDLEEGVIWQLRDGYLRAIDESGLSFLKRKRAKAIINQLADESVGHRDQLRNLISNYGRQKK